MFKEIKHYRYQYDDYPSVPEIKYLISRCIIDGVVIDLEIGKRVNKFSIEKNGVQSVLLKDTITIVAESEVKDIQNQIDTFKAHKAEFIDDGSVLL